MKTVAQFRTVSGIKAVPGSLSLKTSGTKIAVYSIKKKQTVKNRKGVKYEIL
jgi:hypothetical protein